MSKLLLIVALPLLVATSSSDYTDSPDQEEVPHFFQMPDKQNAKMCCTQCFDEETCFISVEYRRGICRGSLDQTQIGRVNYTGGRMIATSKLPNDMWKLLWIDDEDEPLLNNRVFSWNKCAWKSKVRTDYSEDGAAVVDKLVDLTHKQEVLVSLEPIGCSFQSCDITFLLKESFFGNLQKKTRDSPKATPKPKFEKEDL
ncbi:hypothetical protein TKK_0011773 [Trichogramma kaykai]|uniref:Apple domain-containing protein n=1 Tax=Trichogramma kaykai TaxID=54128 RepID=A0ABD2WQS8_9HYME